MGSGRRGRSGDFPKKTDAEALFSEAVAAHRAGVHAKALRLYKQVLKQIPDHPSALNFSGVLAFWAGDEEDGLARLRRSLDLAPDNARLHSNAGEIFREAKAYDAAERALRHALKLAPGNPAALSNLGCVLRDTGDRDGAETYFRAALALNPGQADAAYNLGALLCDQGRYEDAKPLFRASLASRPGDGDALAKLGECLVFLSRDDEALEALEQALQRGDSLVLVDPLALVRNLASLYKRQHRYEAATDALRRAVRRFPDRLDVRGELAIWLEENNATDDARALVHRTLEKAPGDPQATLVMARLDQREEKWAQARRRLESLPRHAWTPLVYFDLAKSYDREGDAAQAFSLFTEGNQLVARQSNWRIIDKTIFPAVLDRVASWSTPANLRALPSTVPDDGLPTPAFLVGFNRSGTTLLEQVLAADGKVVISDEVPFLSWPLALFRRYTGNGAPIGIEGVTDAQVGELRASYWRAVTDHFGEEVKPGQILLDKLPLNLCHLVAIRRMFPDAPILAALRDPRDVVLSNFMQVYSANFATVHFLDLEDTARAYVGTMDLWRRYRADLAGPWHEVRYEDMVGNFDATVRGALEFLGLPWDESYRRFHKKAAKRIISTPSARDVTQPVFSRAVGRWRRYADALAPVQDMLAPMVQALGYADEGDG